VAENGRFGASVLIDRQKSEVHPRLTHSMSFIAATEARLNSYKLVALTNAVEGKDGEFGQWYDRQHIPDVLAVPGFISAERFILSGKGQHRYMTIYEIETDDLDAVKAELASRLGTDRMPITEAVDPTNTSATFWIPLAPQ
jgi:hypothetical protein